MIVNILSRVLLLAIVGIGVNRIGKSYSDYKVAEYKASNAYIRDRVVMIRSAAGLCSGIQVKAPSGRAYILTARHCGTLLDPDTNSVSAIMENGRTRKAYLVKVSIRTDLLLLTAVSDKSIDVAKSVKRYDKVHTLTHGKGLPTHRTDGEIIDTQVKTIEYLTITFDVITAIARSGSSGGPVLNEAGELVGIVSAKDYDLYSYSIPLAHIKAFIADR